MHLSNKAFKSLAAAAFHMSFAGAATATPVSAADEIALRSLSERYVAGWIANDRGAVMGDWAPEGVFIPHDGVQPRVGRSEIDRFWFPNGKAVGQVPAYMQSVTSIAGDDHHATMYGRFDLTWQNGSQRYNWIGNWLMVARKDHGRWLVTHMMVSDADPTITDLAP